MNLETGMLDRQAGKTEIGGMRQHLLDHALGGQRLDVDLLRQQRGVDRRERIRDQPGRQRRGTGDLKRRQRRGADRLGMRPDVPEADQQPLDLGVELHAARRRADAWPAAMEELVADLGLKLADLAGDGRLGSVEQAGRAGDAAG